MRGFVPKARLPRLLALADVLVQPGRAGAFNDYRLPSKLPEFLAAKRRPIDRAFVHSIFQRDHPDTAEPRWSAAPGSA